jgi:hypothetical protein
MHHVTQMNNERQIVTIEVAYDMPHATVGSPVDLKLRIAFCFAKVNVSISYDCESE